MKSSKLTGYLCICCAVFFAAIAGASPVTVEVEAEAEADETLAHEASEPQATLEGACEDAEAEVPDTTGGGVGSEPPSLFFSAVFFSIDDVLEPALEAEGVHQNTGWYTKICVPDVCQPCWSDADCWGWNRCRAQLCP